MRSQQMVSKDTRMLDTHEVSEIIGCSEVSLRRWRVLGGGPPFTKVRGWAVRYHPAHVEAWLLSGMCETPSARGGQE